MQIVRTSDRQMFKSCRRKWDLGSKIRQNLEPIRSPAAFEFGTAIHAGLEAYYDPRSWSTFSWSDRRQFALDGFRRELAEQLNARREPDTGAISLEDEMDFQERTLLGEGMLKHYCEYWQDKDTFTPLKTEIEFEVPVPGLQDTVYQGRIDALVEDQHGGYWIVDHKTRGQFGGTDHYELDEQSGSYCWALQEMLGLKIEGVIFNELLKSVPKKPELLVRGGLSKNRSQRTTYELYLQALKDNNIAPHDYLDFLEFLREKGNPFFRRIQVHRSQTELKNLGEQIRQEALDMFDPNLRIYPAPGMFNCMGCSYRLPCLAINDGSDVQWIIEANFKKREEANV